MPYLSDDSIMYEDYLFAPIESTIKKTIYNYEPNFKLI